MTSEPDPARREPGASRCGAGTFVVLLGAALLAHVTVLRAQGWLDFGALLGGASEPRLAALLTPVPATATATLAVRALLLAGIAACGLLVARAAQRASAVPAAALGAGLLFVAAPAGASVLWHRSGAALLAGAIAFTLLLGVVLRPRRGALGRAGLAVVAGAGASLVLGFLAIELAPSLAGAGSEEGAVRLAPLSIEAAKGGFGTVFRSPFLVVRPTSLAPTAFLLPAVAAIACIAALVLRRATLPVAAAFVVVQAFFAPRDGGERALLARGMPHAFVAARLAALDASPAPLERAVLAAASGELALGDAIEQRLGLAVADSRAARGRAIAAALAEPGDVDADGALAWLDRWLGARETAARAVLPAASARRIALLLERRGPDAAASRTARELAVHGEDSRWVAAVASVLVDALCRGARDRALVDTLLPLVDRLLDRAASNPESATADELLGLALLRTGEARFVEAVRLAELAARREPDRARPHAVLARIYLDRGERDAGLREIALARRLEPDDEATRLLQGRLLCASAERAGSGVAQMLAAFAAAPSLPGAREEIDEGGFAAAAALIGRGRLEEAAGLVERVIAAVGRRPALLHALGRLAAQRREFDAAVRPLEEAFAAAPERPELRRELAEALRDAGYARLLAGDRTGGHERFRRAVEVAPPELDVAGMRAVLEGGADEGRNELDVIAARTAFEEATRLYAAGEREAAKSALERSIELLPLNPLAHLNLGRIELELGRAGEAEVHLRTAIAIGAARAIDVEEAWLFLLRALAAQDATEDELRAAVDDYLERYPSGRFRAALGKLKSGG